MNKIFQKDVFVGGALALIAFIFYLCTLAPSVDFIDSGELATVAATLGIAHPTGYPTFTLLGWVFAHLPLGSSPIWRLNFMAAFFCAAAIYFYYQFFRLLLSEKTVPGLRQDMGGDPGRTQQEKENKAKKAKPLTDGGERIAAAVATLILAFLETYWSQALAVEVYSLHLLLLSLVLLFFLRSLVENAQPLESGSNRSWYLFAFLLGLSFTNHMTTILLAPGFLYLYFATHGFSRNSWAKIGKAVIPFLIPLLLYLYLPLRASQHPVMIWGNPDTWQNFWWHVSGKQYQGLMFSSFGVFTGKLEYFLTGFPSEFGYAPLLFAFFGLVRLFRRARKVLVFSLLLFMGCLTYSLNYRIHDIDSYFLLAYFATVIWIAYGIQAFLESAWGRKQQWAARCICGVLFLFPLILHYSAVDESRNYAVEDYVTNMLGSLDSGAVILSDQGDYFTSPAYYFQEVAKIRPDVTVLDYSSLESPWYYAQLEHRCPWLIQNSMPVIATYLQKYHAYQLANVDFDSATFSANMAVIRSILENNFQTHPFYITFEMIPHFAKWFGEYQGVPTGLAFRLFRGNVVPPVESREFSFRPVLEDNWYAENVKKYYAGAYLNQGIYRATQGDPATGVEFMRKALEIKPDFQDAQAWLQRLEGGPSN